MLAKIATLAPPPSKPVCNGSASAFSDVERRLGIALPGDYRSLVLGYGDGCWQDFWWILNPFSSNPYLNLLKQVSDRDSSILSGERRWRSSHEQYPYGVWPEPSGLLPWAFTDNAGVFFWLTRGEPDAWTTVYFAGRGRNYGDLPWTAGEIVYGAISGDLAIFEEELGGLGSQGAPHFRPEAGVRGGRCLQR